MTPLPASQRPAPFEESGRNPSALVLQCLVDFRNCKILAFDDIFSALRYFGEGGRRAAVADADESE